MSQHASLRRGADLSGDPVTGELRIPVSLWRVDRQDTHVDLVLSGPEADWLHGCLTLFLDRRNRENS
ncbi:hypothetical protein ABT354_35695 [Streptomyces sp. NPDC000594]|uniref:hypothetical protein n=1 Tax=Streptomyces sp. NPDC000594 TaxID=3154261 RepID=UPI003318226C